MGKSPVRPDRNCAPVDPLQFYRRLSYALFGAGRDFTAEDIVEVAFPEVGLDVDRFRDDYLLKEVMRKYPAFQLGIDTKAVALQGLLESERCNKETNMRLARGIRGCDNPRVWQIFQSACRKAISVLGRFSWDSLLEGARHGPRATTRVPSDGGLESKLSGKPCVTLSAHGLAQEVLSISPAWAYAISNSERSSTYSRYLRTDPGDEGCYPVVDVGNLLQIQEFDKVVCVPKNAKTDRVIAIQPDLNVYLQLGVGFAMRQRLWKVGINLNDQSINQRRAKSASMGGRLATIDLKNASGSVTTELVYQMLGNHSEASGGVDLTWYRVMDALRTTCGMVGNTLHDWELFSSMGNGYTFELESLIFWALAVETCCFLGIDPDVTVYGDDLILPSEAVGLLREVFAYAGFSVNEDKSFSDAGDSVFRESCGKHYLGGVDVTPVYVDQPLDTADQIVLLANNLVRWAKLDGYGRDGRIKPVYDWVVSHLSPRVRRTGIPFGEANDGLIKDFDEAHPDAVYLPSCRTHIGYRAITCSTKSRTRLVTGESGYLIWLYGKSYRKFKPPVKQDPYSQKVYVGYGRPSPKQTFSFGKRVVSQWAYLGHWI